MLHPYFMYNPLTFPSLLRRAVAMRNGLLSPTCQPGSVGHQMFNSCMPFAGLQYDLNNNPCTTKLFSSSSHFIVIKLYPLNR